MKNPNKANSKPNRIRPEYRSHPDDPLYCIEPWRSYGASTSGNSVDRGVTLDGSGSTTGSNVWYALPAARREAIGLILLYSNQMWDKSISVTTTKKDSNPNVPLRIATQFLIYEIVCGLRNPTTFESNSTNECGISGDIFYNAGEASVPYFAPKYNALVDTIQAAKKIPSFTASSSGSAPTITIGIERETRGPMQQLLSYIRDLEGPVQVGPEPIQHGGLSGYWALYDADDTTYGEYRLHLSGEGTNQTEFLFLITATEQERLTIPENCRELLGTFDIQYGSLY